MQRTPTVKKYSDDDDLKYPPYTIKEVNHFQAPCGNAHKGRVHFDAEVGSEAWIEWEVRQEAPNGMCMLRLADAPDDQEYDLLLPLDGSAEKKGKKKGWFPCGR